MSERFDETAHARNEMPENGGPMSVANGRAAVVSRYPEVLPDVAEQLAAPKPGRLDRVGMSGIAAMVRLPVVEGIETAGEGDAPAPRIVERFLPARVDASVSLDRPEAKGIHMSRLYLEVQNALDTEPLRPALLESMLATFVASHATISRTGELAVALDYPLRRPALLSGHAGWRTYPVTFRAHREADGRVVHTLEIRVVYSSACPCSAALARAALQEEFDRRFAGRAEVSYDQVRDFLGDESVHAVPHSQRSQADATLVLEGSPEQWPIEEMLDQIEEVLGTPVQAAVKRADEQEFARANGRNLMFCEDAARRIKAALEGRDDLADYRVAVTHLESLHAHDAVAVATRGVPGGLSA